MFSLKYLLPAFELGFSRDNSRNKQVKQKAIQQFSFPASLQPFFPSLHHSHLHFHH